MRARRRGADRRSSCRGCAGGRPRDLRELGEACADALAVGGGHGVEGEVAEDDLELLRVQSPGARQARVDVSSQLCALLIDEATDIDASGSREVREALIGTRQTRR